MSKPACDSMGSLRLLFDHWGVCSLGVVSYTKCVDTLYQFNLKGVTRYRFALPLKHQFTKRDKIIKQQIKSAQMCEGNSGVVEYHFDSWG